MLYESIGCGTKRGKRTKGAAKARTASRGSRTGAKAQRSAGQAGSEPVLGIEPRTPSLRKTCSTTELNRQGKPRLPRGLGAVKKAALKAAAKVIAARARRESWSLAEVEAAADASVTRILGTGARA